MRRLLLAEDNEMIIKGLQYLLDKEKYTVTVCRSAADAEETALAGQFDLVILDVGLPDGSGFDVCRSIKEYAPETPVLFLTAKDEENDVVKGFDLGADDYIIKPFRNRELISRIDNIFRRYHKDSDVLTAGGISVDLGTNRVWRGEEEIVLTALEYRIVAYLFKNRDRTVTREMILSRIWDYADNVVNDNTLTVYIKRIREKLGPDVIKTVKGLGYRVG